MKGGHEEVDALCFCLDLCFSNICHLCLDFEHSERISFLLA